MDTKKAFRSYSKLDEQAIAAEQEACKRKTRKRLVVILTSAVILVAIAIAAVVGTLVPRMQNTEDMIGSSPSRISSTSKSIIALCNVTLYPDSCESSLFKAVQSSNHSDANSIEPRELFLLSLQVALNALENLTSIPKSFISSGKYGNETSNPLLRASLRDCESLFVDTVECVNKSISFVKSSTDSGKTSSSSMIRGIRTLLSTAITDQETCIDGLREAGDDLMVTNDVRAIIANAKEYTSNSLAIASRVMTILYNLHNVSTHHKRLSVDLGHDHFLGWVRRRDRRLLLNQETKPHLTVAQDGSGDCITISEAVRRIPNMSEPRFIIYVKEGIYFERVYIGSDKQNVMIYGDGMYKTIVSGNKFRGDAGEDGFNVTTFSCATFIIEGNNFIVKGMGFMNTAGPEKHQAVALRSSSDQSVFYRCYFDAYQDTLYPHAGTQFYRECVITGTVDFIFGNAAVVLQNCTIQPRQPMHGQFNTITAQGKTDPNQNTGISIQGSTLTRFDNLTALTYLGRPWKNYSTTVVMESYIGGFLHPLGWTEWEKNVTPPNTIFYGEYRNVGPGSIVNDRVVWAGIRPNLTSTEAAKFTVEPFIKGSGWLPHVGVLFDPDL